jgi:hypothetical protein
MGRLPQAPASSRAVTLCEPLLSLEKPRESHDFTLNQ